MNKWDKVTLAIGIPSCLTLVFLVLLLAVFVYDQNYERPSFQRYTDPANKPISNSMRIRCVNTQMLFRHQYNTIPDSLFKDVDILLMQEVFRTPSLFTMDNLKRLFKTFPCVVSAVAPPNRLSKRKLMDSGLAALSVRSSMPITFVAFHAFTESMSVDKYCEKGAAIFDVCGFRLCTVHFQASYTEDQCPDDQEGLRIRQFLEAIHFCRKFGAILLAGDINSSCPSTLALFDSVVEKGGGYRIPDDGGTTIAKCRHSQKEWRNNPDEHGERLDYAWILNSQIVSDVSVIRTRMDVTDGFSDHAAMDFTVTLSVDLQQPSDERS